MCGKFEMDVILLNDVMEHSNYYPSVCNNVVDKFPEIIEFSNLILKRKWLKLKADNDHVLVYYIALQ